MMIGMKFDLEMFSGGGGGGGGGGCKHVAVVDIKFGRRDQNYKIKNMVTKMLILPDFIHFLSFAREEIRTTKSRTWLQKC